MLFGDSFIKTMLHLFAHDFRTILYIRGPYFQPDMIELFAPDVLITSETERYLAGVDHDNNGPSLLFEGAGNDRTTSQVKTFNQPSAPNSPIDRIRASRSIGKLSKPVFTASASSESEKLSTIETSNNATNQRATLRQSGQFP